MTDYRTSATSLVEIDHIRQKVNQIDVQVNQRSITTTIVVHEGTDVRVQNAKETKNALIAKITTILTVMLLLPLFLTPHHRYYRQTLFKTKKNSNTLILMQSCNGKKKNANASCVKLHKSIYLQK